MFEFFKKKQFITGALIASFGSTLTTIVFNQHKNNELAEKVAQETQWKIDSTKAVTARKIIDDIESCNHKIDTVAGYRNGEKEYDFIEKNYQVNENLIGYWEDNFKTDTVSLKKTPVESVVPN